MGKASKLKKKLKLENSLMEALDNNDIDEEEMLSNKITIAINVLDAFIRRLDIYESKQYKLLRKAMFPLLYTQRFKYFDPPLLKSDTTLFDIIQEHNISITIFVFNYFFADNGKFYADINKPFRRAMHPFVTYTFPKNQTIKPADIFMQSQPGAIIEEIITDQCPLPLLLDTLSNKIVNNICCDSSNYWKQANNYVSECFRNCDYLNALLALHQVAIQYHSSSNKNLLKLGSLQRWVRECDVSQKEDISMLLLHAVLNVIHLKEVETNNKVTTNISNNNDNCIDNNNADLEASVNVGLVIPPETIISRKRTFLESNSTISQVYPYSKIIKTYHPTFIVLKAYPSNAYYSHEYIRRSISIASRELLHNNSESITAAYVHHLDNESVAHISCSKNSSSSNNNNNNNNSSTNSSSSSSSIYDKELISYRDFKERLKVVSHVPGLQRRPVSQYDLNIYMTTPFTIRFFCDDDHANNKSCDNNTTNTTTAINKNDSTENNNNNNNINDKNNNNNLNNNNNNININNSNNIHPVPLKHVINGVLGAFLLTGILTPHECLQFILAAERIGYSPDAVDGIDNIVWLADDSILSTIYARVKELLPPHMDGCKLATNGLNARFRLFRYYPGAIYRPHIDGSWPGSGLLPDGSFSNDAFIGQHSKLTFLIYLNDDFTGGSTTFFMPGKDQIESNEELSRQTTGSINVHEVQPQVGSVLVFPHGSALGSLIHEGSSVLEGVKYVIRTDVLYSSEY